MLSHWSPTTCLDAPHATALCIDAGVDPGTAASVLDLVVAAYVLASSRLRGRPLAWARAPSMATQALTLDAGVSLNGGSKPPRQQAASPKQGSFELQKNLQV
jgi:hypothetical protein